MNAPAGAAAPRDLPPKLRSGIRLAYVAILSLLTLFLGVLALYSLRWELYWDQAYFLYQAFLVNEYGFVPYRDLADFNVIGAIGFMALASKLIGYSSVAWRCLDIAWLAAIGGVTWYMLRGFGRLCAWTAVVVFGLMYLMQPETQLVQREYLILLPIGGACALALSAALAPRPSLRHACIGVLFGLALTMKPQAILALPFVLYFSHERLGQLREDFDRSWKGRVAALCFGCAGVAAVWAIIFVWMLWAGCLSAFLTIVTDYWPYVGNYRTNSTTFITITPREKFWYTVECLISFKNLGGRQFLFIPAVLYFFLSKHDRGLAPEQRSALRLFACCFLAYLAGVIMVGNFHPYNWMPVLYFIVLICAIALVRWPETGAGLFRYSAALFTFCCVFFALSVGRAQSFVHQMQGLEPKTPHSDRVDDLKAVLNKYRRPGDKVQPLDFLGATERVLLDLKMPLATPYLIDFQFYHATKHPFVQRMRDDFLRRIRQEPPRFIIAVSRGRLLVHDPADDGKFRAEVEAFVVANYAMIWNGPGYQVLIRLEKNPDAQQ